MIFFVWKPLERLAARLGCPSLCDAIGSHAVWHVAVFIAARFWDSALRSSLDRSWQADSC
jgi:hypothetical protein